MSDLISRQDAIDAIIADKIEYGLPVITDTQERDFEVFNSSCDRHAKILKELPSAQKTGKWILVSERLPEQDGEYLVTAISDMRTLPFIMITSFFKDSNYGKNHWHTGWSKSEVMAWMLLPEPMRMENES